MRPLRFLLTLSSCILAFFFLLFLGPWRKSNTPEDFEPSGKLSTYLNWRTVSSLFPPSAVISLTDDNSTFFLARPAAFGPLLPVKSLSGELWIGGGFGSTGAEGELGCSDVPGWDDGRYSTAVANVKGGLQDVDGVQDAQEKLNGKKRRGVTSDAISYAADGGDWPDEHDGTDDHLHHPLQPSDGRKSQHGTTVGSKKPVHADIQSLQESAEITGKVVLLSRGGCGFLEKVKWAQRRGGTAVIVGDDIRGAQLVTMYAAGDTSNITIPSLFTSHTTAHLLSSLIPSGGLLGSIGLDKTNRNGVAISGLADSDRSSGQKSVPVAERPAFTTSTVSTKATKIPMSPVNDDYGRKYYSSDAEDADTIKHGGWFSGFFRRKSSTPPDSKRHVGWIQEEFEAGWNNAYYTTTATTDVSAPTPTAQESGGDGFVIGVQDWRDPVLVAEQKEQLLASTPSSSTTLPESSGRASAAGFKGGSITPGSGEYDKTVSASLNQADSGSSHDSESSRHGPDTGDSGESGRWFGRFFRTHHDNEHDQSTSQVLSTEDFEASSQHPATKQLSATEETSPDPVPHEGLWVTLTPTSVSSSPFFDTLLVLVVSPLVTLTIVYALLLLRSRIRRRRWRAPKSVVERLPVRTYQTMPSTTATSSATSSISSPVTSTTPLLPSNARAISTRSRPRSRTVAGTPLLATSSLHSDDMASPSLEQIEEKRAAGLAEWRRRYGGRQRECVVCLEEYVDGVSRVMSLPCGHEFHAECITPWLTTRRRTCPICKGDVVRSLFRNSGTSSSPLHLSTNDEDLEEDSYHSSAATSPTRQTSDDIQEQAVTSRNDDPAAARPVSRETETFEDLERGDVPDRTR